MTATAIKYKIDSFPRWHYEFDILGQKTPIFDKQTAITHRHRKAYFFDPLVKHFGGSLRGKRVLDLGCNAGWWSLLCIQNGADFVLGVDGRQMHIDQANFVFETKEVPSNKFEFRCQSVFDLHNEKPFDIVLCLGLLYHVSQPVQLFDIISKLNSDVLVIDTTLSQRLFAGFEYAKEELSEPRHAIDHEIVLLPTIRAVKELAFYNGYSCIMLRRPNIDAHEDINGAKNYEIGARRAFICSKKSELRNFPSQIFEDTNIFGKKINQEKRDKILSILIILFTLFLSSVLTKHVIDVQNGKYSSFLKVNNDNKLVM